ncbi:MAG: hypothetical protein WCA15_04150 [Candidatus Acidiferrales bacterium]
MAGSSEAIYYPLQQTQIREAYLLGHSEDPQKVSSVLELYTRRFPLLPAAARVESIEFRTPYEQVIRRASERSNDYDLDQAEKDYAAQPDLVMVRVLIYLPQAHSGSTAPASVGQSNAGATDNEWLGFHFQISQERPIEPRKMRAQAVRAGRYDKGTRKEVLMEFGADQFGPGAAKIVVTTPNGQAVTADFDLDELK